MLFVCNWLWAISCFALQYFGFIQCVARIARHRAISLSPRSRLAKRFDPQMGSDFESLGINSEARAVISRSWTLIFRISEMDVCFYWKKCLRGTPAPRHTVTRFLQSYGLTFFFWVLYVVDFCDFQYPEIPFWRSFSSIFGSLGPLQKQVKACH